MYSYENPQKTQKSFLLESGQEVKGMCYHISQLKAKFQSWAEDYGVTPDEVDAIWMWDHDEAKTIFFRSVNEADRVAQSGLDKIKGLEIPDLSNMKDLPSSYRTIGGY